jgi:hypothetical protein
MVHELNMKLQLKAVKKYLQGVLLFICCVDASCVCGDVILNQRDVAVQRRLNNVGLPYDARDGCSLQK